MALSRIKVWIPGDVLTAADLNAEFNNILNNPITLVSPTTGIITFTTSQTFPIDQVVSTASQTVNVAQPSRVLNLFGILSSSTGVFSADGYVFRSTSGKISWSCSATSSYTASVATAGPTAGGRDVAAAFASTYVHWYAITTGPFSTAPAGLVSSSPPNIGPTALPSSYQGWCYLGGSVYSSNSTGVLSEHFFSGNQATYTTPATLISGGTSTSITAVPYSSAAPPNARIGKIRMEPSITGSTGAVAVTVTVNHTTGSGLLANIANIIAAAAGLTFTQYFNADLVLGTTGPSYQLLTTSAGQAVSISLLGYTMPNGA